MDGSREAQASGRDVRSPNIETGRDWLLALVDTQLDQMLEEIRSWLVMERSFNASVSVIWRFCLACDAAASGITAYLNAGGHARRGAK